VWIDLKQYVLGTVPSARWGHVFTAANNNLIVFGGYSGLGKTASQATDCRTAFEAPKYANKYSIAVPFPYTSISVLAIFFSDFFVRDSDNISSNNFCFRRV
jgi:hypothetical protein